jgi:hypothetical protein
MINMGKLPKGPHRERTNFFKATNGKEYLIDDKNNTYRRI